MIPKIMMVKNNVWDERCKVKIVMNKELSEYEYQALSAMTFDEVQNCVKNIYRENICRLN